MQNQVKELIELVKHQNKIIESLARDLKALEKQVEDNMYKIEKQKKEIAELNETIQFQNTQIVDLVSRVTHLETQKQSDYQKGKFLWKDIYADSGRKSKEIDIEEFINGYFR